MYPKGPWRRAGGFVFGVAVAGEAHLRRCVLAEWDRKSGGEATAIQMKKCQAFYPIAGTRKAWIPCVRKAEEGSAFCRRHGDAILGAMLGALVYAEAVDEVEHLCGEARPCEMAVARRRT